MKTEKTIINLLSLILDILNEYPEEKYPELKIFIEEYLKKQYEANKPQL